MLQTFGFDISIDHPHTHVIRATQFMRGDCLTIICALFKHHLSTTRAEPSGVLHGDEFVVLDDILPRDALRDRRRHLHLSRLQMERVRSGPVK